jgi:hypothetical protein
MDHSWTRSARANERTQADLSPQRRCGRAAFCGSSHRSLGDSRSSRLLGTMPAFGTCNARSMARPLMSESSRTRAYRPAAIAHTTRGLRGADSAETAAHDHCSVVFAWRAGTRAQLVRLATHFRAATGGHAVGQRLCGATWASLRSRQRTEDIPASGLTQTRGEAASFAGRGPSRVNLSSGLDHRARFALFTGARAPHAAAQVVRCRPFSGQSRRSRVSIPCFFPSLQWRTTVQTPFSVVRILRCVRGRACGSRSTSGNTHGRNHHRCWSSGSRIPTRSCCHRWSRRCRGECRDRQGKGT